MIYQCIDQLQQKADGVASLCRLLGVSRSGYYAAPARVSQPTRACSVTPHLQAAFVASGRSYGSRRLCVALRDRGIEAGRHRVRTLMRINDIRPIWKRKFVHTTDSRHALPIAQPCKWPLPIDNPGPGSSFILSVAASMPAMPIALC